MKILMIVNLPLPEASILMGEKVRPYGGWLINVAKSITEEGHELIVAFPRKNKKIIELQGEKIKYVSFSSLYRKQHDDLMNIIHKSSPNIIHIFGSEYTHSNVAAKIGNQMNIPVILSTQGLVSAIANHVHSFLPTKIIHGKTIRNFVFRDHVDGLKKSYIARGLREKETIGLVRYVIGRTTWDSIVVKQINNSVQYYSCNETLRDGFYENSWDMANIEEHSIFASQGGQPIKGLHLLLEALSILKERYPNIKLYIAGNNFIDRSSLYKRLKTNYFEKYIQEIIQNFDLEKNVTFTGELNENEMINRYKKSNVFVCPSVIENSPNSLGEAMILGMPIVASYVGGIPDFISHGKDGYLYQADAPYMLAGFISRIFEDKETAKKMGENAKQKGNINHDRDKNAETLFAIYGEVLRNSM